MKTAIWLRDCTFATKTLSYANNRTVSSPYKSSSRSFSALLPQMRHSRAFRLSACHSAACSLSPSATVFSVSPNGLFRPAIEPLSCRGRAFAACRKSPSGMPEEQSVRCVASFSSCRLDENGAAAPSPPCRDTVSVPSPSLFCRFALSKIFTWRIRFHSFPSSLCRSAVAP